MTHELRQLCRALRAVPVGLPDDIDTTDDLVVWLCAYAGVQGDPVADPLCADGFGALAAALTACGFMIPATSHRVRHLTYSVLAHAHRATSAKEPPAGFDWRARLSPGGN